MRNGFISAAECKANEQKTGFKVFVKRDVAVLKTFTFARKNDIKPGTIVQAEMVPNGNIYLSKDGLVFYDHAEQGVDFV